MIPNTARIAIAPTSVVTSPTRIPLLARLDFDGRRDMTPSLAFGKKGKLTGYLHSD
jgi:hypothetical protein